MFLSRIEGSLLLVGVGSTTRPGSTARAFRIATHCMSSSVILGLI